MFSLDINSVKISVLSSVSVQFISQFSFSSFQISVVFFQLSVHFQFSIYFRFVSVQISVQFSSFQISLQFTSVLFRFQFSSFQISVHFLLRFLFNFRSDFSSVSFSFQIVTISVHFIFHFSFKLIRRVKQMSSLCYRSGQAIRAGDSLRNVLENHTVNLGSYIRL